MVDALVSLLCRENISAETLWCGGWLLRQLLPYSQAEFNHKHLKMLNVCFFQNVCSVRYCFCVSLFLSLPLLAIYQFPADIRIHMRNAKKH